MKIDLAAEALKRITASKLKGLSVPERVKVLEEEDAKKEAEGYYDED